MADKKAPVIIIKKVYTHAGHHGGSWKVALADFMTAMMAFFLVMWLLNQTEETKKAVSDYFSTPSIIEYNFQNFGVEITLEKLFLDLINEPLKAFQEFLEPVDKTPNLLDMGTQKVVSAYMADKMEDLAKNFSVSQDGFEFDVMDTELFLPETAVPIENFVTVMDRIQSITVGLEDADVSIESRLFVESVAESKMDFAKNVASERLDLIEKRVKANLEHSTVDVMGQIQIGEKKGFVEGSSPRPPGMIHFSIKQKEKRSDNRSYRKLEVLFGDSNKNLDVYENFVHQLANQKSPSSEEKSNPKVDHKIDGRKTKN